MKKQGKLKKCSYRSFGQQLQQDIISVEFEVDGEIHEHPYPKFGWNYNNPALLFLGFLGKKPTDIEGTSFEVDGIHVPVKWVNDEHGYLIDDQVIVQGKQFLKQADWFNPEGEVHDSEEKQAFDGMNVDGGTGNQATVDVGGE